MKLIIVPLTKWRGWQILVIVGSREIKCGRSGAMHLAKFRILLFKANVSRKGYVFPGEMVKHVCS